MGKNNTFNKGVESSTVQPDFNVAFILSPSFTILAFSGFIDCLRHCADDGDNSQQIHCTWTIIGPSLKPIKSSCGAEIPPWSTYDDVSISDFDYVVIVGGLLSDFDRHDPQTFKTLRHAHQAGCAIVGLCTGSFAIAAAGLLSEGRCCIHYRHREEFKNLYPDIITTEQEVFCEYNNIFTCPGGTAAIDLAVELIARHSGRARATKGLIDMIVDKHRGAFHIPPLPSDQLETCGNSHVEQAVKLMRWNLSQPYSIAKLAGKVGISSSQLQRSFLNYSKKTPAAFWRELRLRHARWRLLEGRHSITEIALECGFSDGPHFTRSFQQFFGEAPSCLRKSKEFK